MTLHILRKSVAVGALLCLAALRTEQANTPSGKLVVLGGGNRVLIVDVASHRVLVDSQLVPDFTSSWGSPGASVAQGKVFAPLWRTGAREAQIVEVDGTSGSLRRVATVENVDAAPWLEVGQKTGHLYVISDNGDQVRVLDARTGRQLSRMINRSSGLRPMHDDAYAVAISPDERRLYVSYHGTHTSGIDWFRLADSTLIDCSETPMDVRRMGCIPSHGYFVMSGNGLIVDLSDNHGIREVDSLGTEINTFDISLPGNHMVVFAVDANAGTAYSLGDCGYTGGLSATPLRPTGAQARFTPRPICGTIIRLSPDGTWLAIPSRYGITIVDSRTGKTLTTIPLPVAVENVMVIR